MYCRITEMHDKEVINLSDGMRLGCVDDVEVDVLGLGGKEEDLVIGWRDIEVIGEDTILVRLPMLPALPQSPHTTPVRKKEKILKNIIR